jgi:hypothetical protein
MCCSSNEQVRSKSEDRLARNHDNVSEWSDMSTCGLLYLFIRLLKDHIGDAMINWSIHGLLLGEIAQ